MTSSLYDDTLLGLIRSAAERLRATLERDAPRLAARTLPWLESLSRGGRLDDYFTHPRRFPMLLLPWWAAEGAGSQSDLEFHGEVVYSTMSAYYYVRLIDDLVDRRGTPDLDTLPVAAVLHTECLCPYLPYFPADSPFWSHYRSTWFAATDAAADDSTSQVVDLETFVERALTRLGPATIPLAAVCFQAERSDLLDPWIRFTRSLGRVEQMLDDLSDWKHDLERGLDNILLAEARRRVGDAEPIEAWVLREGIEWSLGTTARWLDEVRDDGASLGSNAATRFVRARRSMLDDIRGNLAPGLAQLRALESVFPLA